MRGQVRRGLSWSAMWRIVTVIGLSVIAVTPSVSLHGQGAGRPASSAAKPTPRTPDGKPDFSGVWIANSTIRLLEGEQQVEAMRQADLAAGRPPLPPPEPLSYKPEYEKVRQEYLARRGIDDPMARCLISGVPRISVRPLPFQIVQTPGLVVFLYEVHHAFRIIPTDGRPHPEDFEPSYLGDSTARWDGNTLVVDIVGFNTRTWLAGVGTVHSEQLHVTERYTRDSYDTIRYDVLVEDPEVLTKPWNMHELFRLRPNERIREYECIENNEDLLRIEKLLQNESVFRIK
jgi:hypothetical protein